MKLNQGELRALYGSPTEQFTADMARFIRHLPEQKEEQPVRHIPKRLILIAALILIALTTTAYAVTRPAVLDWLLGYAPAGEALTQSAQEIHAEASADGMTIRVTSLVWDGSRFAVAYEAEADDPTQAALFRLDPTFTIGGREAAFPPSLEPEMHFVPSTRLDLAPVTRNPASHGQWSGDIEGLSGQVECVLTFRIYRPEKAFAFLIGAEDDLRNIDAQSADYQVDLRDQWNCLTSLTNAIIPDVNQQDEAYWIEQGYTVYEENLTETAEITVKFVFDAELVQTRDYSDTADVELPGATLHIERFVLSPLKTQIDLWLIPADNTREAAEAFKARHGAFTLTDGSGAPVTFHEMDELWDEAPDVTERNGQWVVRYSVDIPGVSAFPETIVFGTQAGELLRFPMVDKP